MKPHPFKSADNSAAEYRRCEILNSCRDLSFYRIQRLSIQLQSWLIRRSSNKFGHRQREIAGPAANVGVGHAGPRLQDLQERLDVLRSRPFGVIEFGDILRIKFVCDL